MQKAKKEAEKLEKLKAREKQIQETFQAKVEAQNKTQDPLQKLAILLSDPPRKSENTELKYETFILVMQVVCSIKAKELQSVLKLSQEHLEVLLEYIYKGWERLSNKDPKTMQVMVNTSILVLHKSIVQKLGIGSILKVANYQENRV